MSTIAYLRVSTNEQAESGLGLAAQMTAIEKAVGKPDLIFQDKGFSGSNHKRPGLLKALNCLRKGDVLIIAKRDRLARDTFFALWCEKEAKRRGATIRSAAGEGTDTNDPAGELMRTLVDAFATYERQLIGQRTSAALQCLRASGKKTGGYVPFGYDLATDGQTLTENKEEQEAISIIHELKKRGYSLRAIAAELEERGIQAKRGKTWQPVTISRLLKRAA